LAPVPPTISNRRLEAPTGRWKDGLCDCFKLGLLHPHVWCAFFCSKIAMAQVMTRMQLTWLGEPGPFVATRSTFKVVLILLFSYIVYSTSLELASLDYSSGNLPVFIIVAKTIGSVLFSVWSIFSLCRTRQSVRERYSIAEERCAGCEDCCCAFWCTCCVVGQLSRHTGEYETYPAVCCTETGHPPGTPLCV
jgi:Cys-rich protein (TIGR01571 family)